MPNHENQIIIEEIKSGDLSVCFERPCHIFRCFEGQGGRVMKTIASTHFECIRIFAAIMLLFLFLHIWRDFCLDNTSVYLTPRCLFSNKTNAFQICIFSSMWNLCSVDPSIVSLSEYNQPQILWYLKK